jgi:hypothetical protein
MLFAIGIALVMVLVYGLIVLEEKVNDGYR